MDYILALGDRSSWFWLFFQRNRNALIFHLTSQAQIVHLWHFVSQRITSLYYKCNIINNKETYHSVDIFNFQIITKIPLCSLNNFLVMY